MHVNSWPEPDKNVDQKNVYISPQLKNFLRTLMITMLMLFQNACGSLLEYFFWRSQDSKEILQ